MASLRDWFARITVHPTLPLSGFRLLPLRGWRSYPAQEPLQEESLTSLKQIVPVVIFTMALPAGAQDAKSPYPKMAPLEQYLIRDRNAEIALARSAAPDSISRDADVLVLTLKGYELASKGKNGFVCTVERSWTAGIEDPDFWNPKLRAPICFNAPAARSYLPHTIKKTEWILAGKSKAQMFDALKVALDKKELLAPEPGSMCYMMSKQGYLSDRDGHWHPHLMFFAPLTDASAWGADQAGSPILAGKAPEEQLTIFLVPVGRWSDGTAAQ